MERLPYSAKNPLIVRARDAADVTAVEAEVAAHFATGYAVKVWHNMEVGGGRGVWITGPTESKPDWRAGDPVLVTDAAAVAVRLPIPAQTVVRTYVDLDLFTLAAGAARVRVTLSCPASDEEYEPDEAEDSDVEGWSVLTIHHDREAYDGNGDRCGTERMRARLSVVPAGGDASGVPGAGTLSRWLVRIDEVETELVDHPAEPVVREGWRDSDGAFHVEEPDPDEEGCDFGFEVDGDFLTTDEYERMEGGYSVPDGEFVRGEMERVLDRILGVGAHRHFDRERGAWSVRDGLDAVVG